MWSGLGREAALSLAQEKLLDELTEEQLESYLQKRQKPNRKKMIGEGKFRADLARCFDLLKALDLASYRNLNPRTDASTVNVLRGAEEYVDLYNAYFSNQAFDFSLEDGSLMFFRRNAADKTMLSYGYLESPYARLSYEEFIDEYFKAELIAGGTMEEYENYLSQVPLRKHIVPLRFDWSPSLYREGAHPAAHLHVGYNTEMRIAVDAVLTLMQFVLLVLRHFYVEAWEGRACQMQEVVREANAVSELHVVPDYRKGRDLLELRLTVVR